MIEVVVAKASDLKPGEGKAIEVNGRPIALFNVNGEFFAIDNTCLHSGGPLGEGEVEGKTVTCPWHGWQYDVTTGQCTVPGGPMKVQSYKVVVKGDDVVIEV